MKTEINLLATVVKAKAGRTIIRRSDDYLNRVDDLKVDFTNKVIRAKVGNSKGDIYNVKWDLANRSVSCSCPAHRHGKTVPCKHAVATFRVVFHEFN
jgi:uncharacterized Zn finger protein